MVKRLLILFLLLIALGLGWLKLQGRKGEGGEAASLSVEESIKVGVTLVLDYGDGEAATYSGIPVMNSVYDVLQKIAEREGVSVESQQYDFGVFVKSIAGRENSNERAWIYFVNGVSGEVAADQKNIRDGDVIEWKYIEPGDL